MTASAVKGWLKRRATVVGSVVSTTSTHVVLTYDDGPDEHHTPGILDALASHDATATFFVLLTRTRRLPSIVEDIVSAGHEVALHGPDHRALPGFTYDQAYRRTGDAKSALEDQLGRSVHWFRPPYGAQSLTSWRATRAQGLTPVLWSATTWDWKDVDQSQRVARAVGGAGPGAILLAHDGYAGPDDGASDIPAPQVDRAQLANLILSGHAEKGLSCVSLGEALKHSSPVLAASFSRHPAAP